MRMACHGHAHVIYGERPEENQHIILTKSRTDILHVGPAFLLIIMANFGIKVYTLSC